MGAPAPVPPPSAPGSSDGVFINPAFPAASSVVVEQNFDTYNQRFRAVPAEVAFINVTAATTLEYTPIIVRVSAASAGVTITLPQSSSGYGRQLWIVKTDATANAVTIAVQTGDNLWRPSTITTITAQYGCQTYLSTFDGTNGGWQYVGGG